MAEKDIALLDKLLAQMGLPALTDEQRETVAKMEEDIKHLQVQIMVKALNAAVNANKAAMHALLINRVPVGQEMIDDPHMVVDSMPGSQSYSLGMLGVINGILSSVGMPRIAARWEKEVDEGHNFVGFMIYEPKETSDPPGPTGPTGTPSNN